MEFAGDNAVTRSSSMTTAADRHLLFGLLALQNGIISQVQLVAAFQAWTLDSPEAWPTTWKRAAT
jgi:hypothetical protein